MRKFQSIVSIILGFVITIEMNAVIALMDGELYNEFMHTIFVIGALVGIAIAVLGIDGLITEVRLKKMH